MDVTEPSQAQVQRQIRNARSLCQAKNAKLTPLREAVYTLMVSANKPLGAYDVLDALAQQPEYAAKGKRVAPATVYRALDFLQAHGLVHQLATLNAFVSCDCPKQPHTAAFLLCQQCHRVEEYTHAPFASIKQQSADEYGFLVKHTVLEVQGVCAPCQQKPPA